MSTADVPKQYILVVEDEEEIRGVLVDRLVESGFHVRAAASIAEGIRYIKNQKFICIITDLGLEEESGQQIIEFAREDEFAFNFETPIIVMSGEIDSKFVKNYRAKIQGVLVKPFPMDRLLSLIVAANVKP